MATPQTSAGMGDKQKVLICGNVDGNLKTLFSRVGTLNKKSGPFDLLLVTGRFFGKRIDIEDYKNGSKKVDVPTYILGPSNEADSSFYPENEGEEIFPNVTFLGKKGLYTTSSGLKIAYLSGTQSKDDKSTKASYTKDDCAAVRNACYRGQTEYKGIDILITSEWPEDIQNLHDPKIEISGITPSISVSWLAMHLKPRYHFVASPNIYYERPPYRNFSKDNQIRELATRFIGIAPVGNEQKQKWLYACSLQTLNKIRMMDLLLGTTDETECPYNNDLLYLHTPGGKKDLDNGQYFYNMNSADDRGGQKRRRRDDGQQERKRPEFDLEKCWFCLSSPTVEKHLVICVGDHCYLALAKGPLNEYHCLILPITHHQSYTQAPDEIKDEIARFKSTIVNFFSVLGCVAVFFERNYKTTHLQIQCVPLPEKLANGLIDEIESIASGDRIVFKRLSANDDICDIVPPGVPYFHMTLPDGDHLFTKTGPNFPLQFGRDILSHPSLLNCEEKADWRSCELSREEEMTYVSRFRKKFDPFDFTQDD